MYQLKTDTNRENIKMNNHLTKIKIIFNSKSNVFISLINDFVPFDFPIVIHSDYLACENSSQFLLQSHFCIPVEDLIQGTLTNWLYCEVKFIMYFCI